MSQGRVKERDLEGLRRLLNAWDPIGVAEFEVDDEYDCLLGPITGRLSAGASRREVAAFVQGELTGHFGLSGRVPAELIDDIFAWWDSAC